MKKTLGIPAAEWRKAKTEEDRAALREKYSVEMTAEEQAEFMAFQEAATAEQEQAAKDAERQKIITELEDIDRKSIRALREGNKERIASLEGEAEKLREKLKEKN